MNREWNKDLTVLVTGTGTTTMENLRDNLEDWIFGDLDSRDVKFIVPVFSHTLGSLKTFFAWAAPMGFEFIVVRTENAPMIREISSLPEDPFLTCTSDRETLDKALNILEAAHVMNSNETAFMMQYNPESVYKQGDPTLTDCEIIGDAKAFDWLTTLNICEGLQDSFEGYESESDRIDREMKEEAFALAAKAEQDRLNALAVESGVAPKKATVPRKRAAKKAAAPVPKETPVEPEKGPESLPVGSVVVVAGTEFTKVGPNPFREPLPTTQPAPSRALEIQELGKHIDTLTNAVHNLVELYTRLTEEN